MLVVVVEVHDYLVAEETDNQVVLVEEGTLMLMDQVDQELQDRVIQGAKSSPRWSMIYSICWRLLAS